MKRVKWWSSSMQEVPRGLKTSSGRLPTAQAGSYSPGLPKGSIPFALSSIETGTGAGVADEYSPTSRRNRCSGEATACASVHRSEERRVGKECRSRGGPEDERE